MANQAKEIKSSMRVIDNYNKLILGKTNDL
jgi:hypothetical protein